MPDLWKALGDVYGDADARPVPVEPAADDRGLHRAPATRLDDDLAAALSAALVDGPVHAAERAPVAAPVFAAPVVPPVVAPPTPVAPAPVVAVAPAPVAPIPVAPAAVVAVDGAQERVSTWLADIDARQKLREQGPPVATIEAVGHAWRRGDDDILPAKAAVKRGRRKG